MPARRRPPPNFKFKSRYIRGGMDMKFIYNNWSAINETPIKRAGLLIRTIMRQSIRRVPRSKKTGLVRQKGSTAGRPPYARYGIPKYVNPNSPKQKKGGRKSRGRGLPFKYIVSVPFDKNTKAVIGHVKLPWKNQDPVKTPMQAHEFGERVQIQTMSLSALQRLASVGRRKARTEKQRKAARRLYIQGRIKQRSDAIVRKKTVKMPKRPFAEPALKKGRARIGQFWKDRINKGTIRKIMKFPKGP